MGAWYGAEARIEFEAQGGATEFRNGLKMRLSGKVGGRELSITAVVTEFERGRVLEWQFQDGYGVRGMQRWEIEAASGGTRLRMRDRYEMPGRFEKFFDWLVMRHAVARRDRGDLERLKRLVEHRGGAERQGGGQT
jgi:uncharacterized membrane protein